jgi:cellulose biosynthesis protein BcsQ
LSGKRLHQSKSHQHNPFYILQAVKTRLNPALKRFGLVAVQVNPRSRLHLDVVDIVRNEFGAQRLVGSIRNDIKIPKFSLDTGINFGLATASNGVRDYSELGDTLLNRWIPSMTKATAQDAINLTPLSAGQP